MSPNRQSIRTAADEPFLLLRSAQAHVRSGHVIERHGHGWGQLIYASRGVMTVWTEQGSWVAPPQWAILAPAGVEHAIRFSGDSRFATLYLAPDWATGLPDRCSVVTVSALMRELILEAVRRSMLDRRDPGDAALARLIVDSIAFSERAPFAISQPTSAAARRVAEHLERGADDPPAVLAQREGLTARTLERRFLAETGLSLGRWRTQVLMLQALRSLAGGEPVKVVAGKTGYRSASAFVAAFKAQFGMTPGRYFPGG